MKLKTRTPRTRTGAMVLLYALGVLAIIATLGQGVRDMGSSVAQMHRRGTYEDQAQWAALSGITYGRLQVIELWRAASRPWEYRNEYPGSIAQRPALPLPEPQQPRRQWLGPAWTGRYSSPASHRDAVAGGTHQWDARNGCGVEFHLGTARNFDGTPRAHVFFNLHLDETLIRNGYLFGELSTSGFSPSSTTITYDPASVLYVMEAIGRVEYPHPQEPANMNANRVIALQRAVLTFQLPVSRLYGVPTNAPTNYRVARFYSDRILEYRGR